MKVHFMIVTWEQGHADITQDEYEEYLKMDSYDKEYFVKELASQNCADKDVVEAAIRPIEDEAKS